jgi:hypothetical protein
MKLAKNKTKSATALLLVLTIAVTLVALPAATAHTPKWDIPTYAYMSVAPDPVGRGQVVNVFMWLTNVPPGAAFDNDIRFHNYKLTITAPDGTKTEKTFPTIIDTTSSQFTTFTPDQIGTYNLTFDYPGEVYTYTQDISAGPGAPVGPNQYTNDTFLASSASTAVTVQEEQVPSAITSYPLPTEYWARPIYGENTDWWSISSNWLGNGAPNYGGWTNTGADAALGGSGGMAVFPGDAIGSQTSHVMWTKPLQSGGVVGGNNYAIPETYFDGSAYLIRYNNPIIVDGMLYYTEPVGFTASGYNFGSAGVGYGPTDCVNLRTGQLVWSRTDVPALSFAMVMDVQTQNEHGASPPLLVAASGSTWRGFDGDTGNALFNITNVPTFGSARTMGPDGEYLNYVMTNVGTSETPDWRLAEWNSSLLFLPFGAGAPTFTGTIDASISTGANTRYDWNISIPWRNSMTGPVTIVASKYNDGILCYNGQLPSNGENALFSYVSSAPYTYFFVNLNPAKGAVGSVTWTKTLDPPANNYTVIQEGVDWDTRVFLQSYKEATEWVGYDLDSGSHLWTSEPQAAFDYYGSSSAGVLSGQIAYGKLYSSAYAGILYCYDDKTGDLLWTYGNGGTGNSTNSGYAWPYGRIPTFINAIGNDVVYLVTTEHTWTTPIYKDGLARAINATDGTEIWTISGVTMEFGQMSYAIADGFATWFNGYDNQIYVVGRGPSKTTVNAPLASISKGSSVVITGTVTDLAAGTQGDEQAARFPTGVPCVSDASMKDWMGYVYQQRPLPTNVTGVEVTISVLDSNNNCYDIGTTTTDVNGFYKLQWTPDIEGNFTVYASFAGTNSYWPSQAEAGFGVDPSPQISTPTTTQQADNTATYVMYAAIAIIVVIIIGFAVTVLLLRKR